ncbi:GntR family transcriptional regulator [Oleiharenicola lentus]|uniref:GntR family transcriptional regulator n=1 Tax=Oleiharenicola lentus TaxID=2508720 RepID=UPI003F671D4D
MSVILNQGPQARSIRSLRKWIAEGKLAAGELLPTEHNLMELLKVSRTTVRAALGQLETEGLIRSGENRRRLVCEPVAAPRTNLMANTVCLLTLPMTVPESVQKKRVGPVWERFIQVGAVEALQQAGKDALTLQLSGNYQDRLAQFNSEHPYGLIAMHDGIKTSPAWKAIDELAQSGVSMVIYGFGSNYPTHDTLASDHAAGCAALTRFLLKRGRKRLLRAWSVENLAQPLPGWLAERDRGFEEAMKETNLPVLPALRVPINLREEFSEETFVLRRRLLAGFLLDHVTGPNRVDAILAPSDSVFFPLAAACRQLGLKPGEDIDLVGYDNNWRESVYRTWESAAPLATVNKNNLNLGHELADLLVARAEKKLPAKKQHKLIAPELVIVSS